MDTSKLGLQNYLPNGQPTETIYNNYVLQNSGLFKTINVKDKCVLDVGCGNGRLNILMTDAKQIIGLDLIDRLDARFITKNFRFILDNIFYFDYRYCKFDYILFIGTFYLHNEFGYGNVMCQTKSLLYPDGKIIILDDVKRFHNKESREGFHDIYHLIEVAKLKITDILTPNSKYNIYILGADSETINNIQK